MIDINKRKQANNKTEKCKKKERKKERKTQCYEEQIF